MAFFRFTWARRLVRRHTTPIPYRKAHRWRQRFSVGYMVLTWHLFGYLVYRATTGGNKKEEKTGIQADFDALSPAQRFAVQSGVKKAKIVRDGEVIDFKLDDYQKFTDLFDRNKKKELNLAADVDDADNVYAANETQQSE